MLLRVALVSFHDRNDVKPAILHFTASSTNLTNTSILDYNQRQVSALTTALQTLVATGGGGLAEEVFGNGLLVAARELS